MKTKKFLLSNTTNSKLPDDQLSRIFIGNLNTNQISKKHVLKLFCKFGQIKAISMHKGYAFVQFFQKEHADNAIKKMHGQLINGQVIDVNLVVDPKPHQKKLSLKKSIESQLDNLLESSKKFTPSSVKEITFNSSLNSFESTSGNKVLTYTSSNSLKPTSKETNLSHLNTSSFETLMSSIYEKHSETTNLNLQPYNLLNSTIKYPLSSEYWNYDFMICGACKQVFYNFDLFVQHKQALCLFASSSTKTCITNV